MLETDDEEFDSILDVNLRGVWNCMKAELRQMMITQGSGAITRAAALDYAATGIRINAVCPGIVGNTPMATRVTKNNNSDIIKAFVAAEPIGRLGGPEEIAAAVLWLCSPGANFMVGHAMVVDGAFWPSARGLLSLRSGTDLNSHESGGALRRTIMHFGATMWFTEYSISPSELAVTLEERGFESLWASEHSHLPVAGDVGDEELPKVQADAMDPFLTLMAAAMSTKTLRLGTGICLVNQRDPIQTAKLVASIDQLSGGRFLFGIGNGWHEEEMRNHGTAFATRHQLVQERVEAMRAIWTQDRAEYHGAFVNFGPMIANPKPVQKPHPPVIVGGAYPYAARRAVQYGDGWYALTGAKYGDEFAFIPKFQEMLANAGRDRSTCPITLCLYPEELDAFAPDQVGALARYEELGVTRCIVGFNAEKREGILPVLDRWAGFMRELGTRAVAN